ncbi:hypothetical protein NC651_010998 [Populus alba x Populus x berolinensis]|nr:hypothetical protein NC651_010998 [Populus alba x Populus x berolinensis]
MAATWVVKGKKMVKEEKKGKKGPISELWISILLIMLSFIVTTLLSRLLKRLKSQWSRSIKQTSLQFLKQP